MRNFYCGKIREFHINRDVKICGWVNSIQNLGKIIFIYVRDIEGLIQVVFNASDKKLFNLANQLKQEFCIQVHGIIRKRPNSQISHDIITGKIEILANKLKIFSPSKPLPIDIRGDNTEEKRLKFRYLDLRSKFMTDNIKIRSKVFHLINKFMNSKKFLNIETPILVNPSIEGAENYLVQSRKYIDKFYALQQSPQIFKQLLMISGFDKYYQITKCFRNEDSRSDRQPEFTQIDIEMSFVKRNKIYKITEDLIKYIWKKVKNIKLSKFPKIKYKDAMKRFGSEKPDLRNPIELIDITYLLKNLKTKKNKFLIALKIPKGSKISYEELEKYISYGESYKDKNLEFIKLNDINYFKNKKSNNHFYKKIIDQVILITKANCEDALILEIHKNKKFIINNLGILRSKIGIDLKIINDKEIKPLWITDFPMFKKDKLGNIISNHHPFTAPKNLSIKNLIKYPMRSISNAYDMIINGVEVGSGSIRVNNVNIQKSIFNILKIDEKDQKKHFNFFIEALKYGPPPHSGFAFGLDRLIMLINKTSNIKDVIAFPKTNSALDIMINAPKKIN